MVEGRCYELELIPGINGRTILSGREYDTWARKFYLQIKPELDRWDVARNASNLWAMNHIVRG